MFPVTYVRKLPVFSLLAVLAGILPSFGTITEARDPIPVVATIPVLKDLTEQVGGPHVRVTSLLSGYENEHTYSPSPPT